MQLFIIFRVDYVIRGLLKSVDVCVCVCERGPVVDSLVCGIPIINEFSHIYYYPHKIFFRRDLYSVFNSNRSGYFCNDMCCTVGAFKLRSIP